MKLLAISVALMVACGASSAPASTIKTHHGLIILVMHGCCNHKVKWQGEQQRAPKPH